LPHPSARIAALTGSRICHDLISPVGAIANGLELLELAGVERTPELSLVAQCAAQASARIRLFRLAFGEAGTGQPVAGESVADILATIHREGRLGVEWAPVGPLARPEIKAVLLALLCAEQALGAGGVIAVSRDDDGWFIRATGPRLAPDPALWAGLDGAPPSGPVAPSAVQFLLLPAAAAEAGLACAIRADLAELVIRLTRGGAKAVR